MVTVLLEHLYSAAAQEAPERTRVQAGEDLQQLVVLWGQAAREISPQLQLALPKAGECSGEWERCLGRGVRQGLLCVCYESEQPGLP